MKIKLKKKHDFAGFGKFQPKGHIATVLDGLGARLIKAGIGEEYIEPKEVIVETRTSPIVDKKGKKITVTEIKEKEDGKN